MSHQRSPLGDIPGLGMIRQIDDMMIEGERIQEERQLERETRDELMRQRQDQLNRTYVKNLLLNKLSDLKRWGMVGLMRRQQRARFILVR